MVARPSHRWFRYSLRTLLVLVAVLALFCAWLTGQWRIVQKRKAALAEIGASTAFEGDSQTDYVVGDGLPDLADLEPSSPLLPFWRYWMGDRGLISLEFRPEQALEISSHTMDKTQELFPEVSLSVCEDLGERYRVRPYSVWRAEHPAH